MEMFHAVNRRRFLAAAAGGLLATLPARRVWPVQATSLRRGLGPIGTRWRPTDQLLHHLPRLLELAAVPGLALATVDDGGIVSKASGRACLQPPRGAGDGTVFEAASLGKPLFAYAVLMLVDAGVLDLDRPLHEYLASAATDTPRMRRVTARHVLTHTSGLPNWRHVPGPLEPATEPGETYAYSGEAFFYLQRVVERITGRPIARLLREDVLQPLGMRESSWVWRGDFDARMAVGYDETGNPAEVYAAIGRRTAVIAQEWHKPIEEWRYEDAARVVPLVNPAWPVLPVYMVPNVAASLLTTARDYARFLAHLVAQPGAPAGASAGTLGLRPATREAMMTPQVRINSALAWGLGWGLQEDEYGRTLWQWGANNGFRNFAVADPSNGRAIVVLTNSGNGPRVYERVIVALTGHDHPAFLRA
jgi:CubicO group peptidase (beta-lactamase class C family)